MLIIMKIFHASKVTLKGQLQSVLNPHHENIENNSNNTNFFTVI